ncbi:hypothetical protein EVAR_53865_1 [Eumeta japonica]|uniref:Uncharacterized protein n=1 Tax=Eumeta variegata TaxID=151549 RepID=A0A4C1XIK9_EUMVA|nr:hypothetical protein EVAR_53865_1 [Eumeta japonica]
MKLFHLARTVHCAGTPHGVSLLHDGSTVCRSAPYARRCMACVSHCDALNAYQLGINCLFTTHHMQCAMDSPDILI